MDWNTVLTTVRALLDAEWTLTTVAYPNRDFLPPDGEPWVYVEVLPLDGDGPLFGSDDKSFGTEEGLIAAHVFVPTGTGDELAFSHATALGLLLNRRALASGIQCGRAAHGGAGSGDDEGNWFRVSVRVPVILVVD